MGGWLPVDVFKQCFEIIIGENESWDFDRPAYRKSGSLTMFSFEKRPDECLRSMHQPCRCPAMGMSLHCATLQEELVKIWTANSDSTALDIC